MGGADPRMRGGDPRMGGGNPRMFRMEWGRPWNGRGDPLECAVEGRPQN